MKQITVISGKGGTGKTSMVAAFSTLADTPVVADCDVDAANLHHILKPLNQEVKREVFTSGYEAVVMPDRCRGECGECVDVCRFGAIKKGGKPVIHPLLCEGCGACTDVCQQGAITLVERTAGELLVSETRFGPLVHGRLGIGQSASGKLVSQVRNRAREIASHHNRNLILIDGSPGVGCPVIASLTGVDAAVVVTEPTVSGLHDLERVLTLCGQIRVKAYIILNKWDLNPEMALHLEGISTVRGASILGRVDFDPMFAKAMINGQTMLEYAPGSVTALEIRNAWEELLEAE